jgi:hypothetical protein
MTSTSKETTSKNDSTKGVNWAFLSNDDQVLVGELGELRINFDRKIGFKQIQWVTLCICFVQG